MATTIKKKATAQKATPKKSAPKKSASNKSPSTNSASKRVGSKKSPRISPSSKKNKLGVKNSLVNNINARKEKGRSRSKKKSTISKDSYRHMEEGWDDHKK